MILLGEYALVLVAVLSLAAVLFLGLGVKRRSRELIRNGYLAVYGLFLATVVASAVLLTAFLNNDFGFQYVLDNSDSSLSTFYRIAGFWAGQQGSFLLWLFFLAVITVVIAFRNIERSEPLTGGAVLVLSAVCAFFAVLMVLDKGSNPFVANPDPAATPLGLNPLLLHPAMVLHPPTLFVGYAGLTVPFAFALGTMLLHRGDSEWVRLGQKWTVMAWLFLSIGIGLGAWWAYVVLGWGGYWGWDPVENASFIPWLTATALLHSLNLYVKRGIFRRWTVALATVTFVLTIVATWVTRSGAIQSQHAFQKSPLLSAILIGFTAAAAAVTAYLLATRWRDFDSVEHIEAIASKDFMYYFTNVALTVFAAAILFATVIVPLAMNQNVGPKSYETFARPLGILFLLAIAVCPLMAWGRTEGRTIVRTLRWPAAAAAVAVPLLLLGGWGSEPMGFVGLVVVVFALASVVQFAVLRSRKSRGGSAIGRFGNFLRFSRTRTAMMVSHIGMALIMAGLIGSNIYKTEANVSMPAKEGATATAGPYTLTFRGYEDGTGVQQSQMSTATFTV
ncbi:MAG TPA: cytochrome c biogenesis protein CcsA, partial [Thermoleophilia bacterium]|nr:cytochrome c biogenesis protein CcsA [Thermoleophilia bacterium]